MIWLVGGGAILVWAIHGVRAMAWFVLAWFLLLCALVATHRAHYGPFDLAYWTAMATYGLYALYDACSSR